MEHVPIRDNFAKPEELAEVQHNIDNVRKSITDISEAFQKENIDLKEKISVLTLRCSELERKNRISYISNSIMFLIIAFYISFLLSN